MAQLFHIVDSPYLYEILHSSTLIRRITRSDFDSPRFKEMSFDDLPDEVKRKITLKLHETDEEN